VIEVLMLFPKTADSAQIEPVWSFLLPLMKQAPGLRSLRVSEGDLMGRGAPPPYSRILLASFESLADWMAQVDRLNAPTARPPSPVPVEPVLPLVVYFETTEIVPKGGQ